MTMFKKQFYRFIEILKLNKNYGVTKINIKIRIKCQHYGVNIGECVSDIILLNVLIG